MIGFFSYAPNQMITEAFSTKMKDIFSKTQLSQIGNFLAKQGISAQESEFQFFNKSAFRKKFAAENGYAFVLDANSKLQIIRFENQMLYSTLYDEARVAGLKKYFDNPQDTLKTAKAYFILEVRSSAKDKQLLRAQSKPNDPLLKANARLKRELELRNDYIGEINDKLKPFGYKFTELEKYVRVRSDKNVHTSIYCSLNYPRTNEYATVYVDSALGEDKLKPYISTSGTWLKTDAQIKQYKKELDDCVKVLEIIKSIDVAKIKTIADN